MCSLPIGLSQRRLGCALTVALCSLAALATASAERAGAAAPNQCGVLSAAQVGAALGVKIVKAQPGYESLYGCGYTTRDFAAGGGSLVLLITGVQPGGSTCAPQPGSTHFAVASMPAWFKREPIGVLDFGAVYNKKTCVSMQIAGDKLTAKLSPAARGKAALVKLAKAIVPGLARLSSQVTATKPASYGKPVAGKRWIVTMSVTRADGSSIEKPAASCQVAVAGKTLAVAPSASATGDAMLVLCVASLPAGTSGKQVTGSLTLSFGGQKVSKPFSFTVS